MVWFREKTGLDNVPVPGHVVVTSAAGAAVAIFFTIAGYQSLPSFDMENIKALAGAEAAYVTVVSAFLWLVAAAWDEPHSNAAAAVFTASVGFFASAAFSLPGVAPSVLKEYDEARIWLGYAAGSGLPLMLAFGFFGRWIDQKCKKRVL